MKEGRFETMKTFEREKLWVLFQDDVNKGIHEAKELKDCIIDFFEDPIVKKDILYLLARLSHELGVRIERKILYDELESQGLEQHMENLIGLLEP